MLSFKSFRPIESTNLGNNNDVVGNGGHKSQECGITSQLDGSHGSHDPHVVHTQETVWGQCVHPEGKRLKYSKNEGNSILFPKNHQGYKKVRILEPVSKEKENTMGNK